MRHQRRVSTISARRVKLGIISLACLLPLSSVSGIAWADGFQRIRTFDPATGQISGTASVAGTGAQQTGAQQSGTYTSGQPYTTPPGWSTQQMAQPVSKVAPPTTYSSQLNSFATQANPYVKSTGSTSRTTSSPAGSYTNSGGGNYSGAGSYTNSGGGNYSSAQTSEQQTVTSVSNTDVSNADSQSPQEESTRESKHHKHKKEKEHHHKFLIFGHGDDDEQTSHNAPVDRRQVEQAAVQRVPDIQQNNKLYVPPTPVYVPEPVTSSVSVPVAVPHMPSQVMPPDPRQRPSSPAIDQSARLPFVQNGGAKPSLAWRARAYKLATEPDDPASAARHPSRVLNCSTEEALGAAASYCKSRGAQIMGESLPAGHLGVRFGDNTGSRAFVVFVAKSVGNNRTLLKASADSDKAQKIALTNDLIQQAAAIIDRKGLL